MAELYLWGRPALGRGADRSCAPERKADALAVTAKDAMLLSCLLAHEIAGAHDRQALAPTRRPADLSHIVVGCSEGRKLTTGQFLAAVSAVMVSVEHQLSYTACLYSHIQDTAEKSFVVSLTHQYDV